MSPLISSLELQERLSRAGQVTTDQNPWANGTNVFPSPEIRITVGSDLDPTLKLAFREYYYCCLQISSEHPVLGILEDANFVMPGAFREAEIKWPCKGEFLLGPFRWLLQRLLRFEQILLWPDSGDTSPAWSGFERRRCFEHVPLIRAKIADRPEDCAALGAIVLDLKIDEDCHLLWEAAVSVSRSCTDWHVSDLDCAEVYKMHHHDQAVVSIPDENRWLDVLDELDDLADLIGDFSGYRYDRDKDVEK